MADIDALVAIEQAAFAGDRISRRSFRQLIERETAAALVVEVDGHVAGYVVVLFRKGSGVARLYSIGRTCGRAGLGRALLQAAESAAFDRERLLLRLEVREDNHRAITLYRQNGYRRIGREPDYYHDGMAALRFEKTLRGQHPAATGVPYYPQSWDFTCGPCCLMMAAGNFLPGYEADRTAELRLWRQATTVFMMSGAGGCEPFGLAVAAHDLGPHARLFAR
jgi:ribosomal protein S18 acetylase RimI-like enzyme